MCGSSKTTLRPDGTLVLCQTLSKIKVLRYNGAEETHYCAEPVKSLFDRSSITRIRFPAYGTRTLRDIYITAKLSFKSHQH